MDGKAKEEHDGFTEILIRAYEIGISKDDVTVDELIEEIKEELKQMLVH